MEILNIQFPKVIAAAGHAVEAGAGHVSGGGIFDTIAVILVLAAIFAYINKKYIKLPETIALMLLGLGLALVLLIVGTVNPAVVGLAKAFVEGIDFNEAVMSCLLSFLLFAGSLHVNLDDLAKQKWLIGILASVGVCLSTALVGIIFYWAQGLFGFDVPLVYCFVFGALISPTDPVAVLGILKKAGVPKSLETKITGESLFNDGVGVVVFLVLLGLAQGQLEGGAAEVGSLFIKEAGGGIFLGLLLGGIGYFFLKRIDDHSVEILLTLALVTGGYSLAMQLHISGPLAMVVAGLWIGNHGRRLAMSDSTRQHLDQFWELIDEILNAFLFVLIGIELLAVQLTGKAIGLGVVAIAIALTGRFCAVLLPIAILRKFQEFTPGVIKALTWGGLRGGISVALALSLPKGDERDLFLTVTYIVVIFSITVQGLTLGKVVKGKK